MTIHPGVHIHETACVDEPCTIGAGTHVWHFTHIRAGAMIGERCNIGQNVYIGRGVHIGAGTKIQNNVSVYESVVVEEEVFLGPSMVFTNVVNPRAAIERKDEFLATRVCRGATIGANATILCGITIGRFSMVGAGTVVLRDVPDHALVVGNPARQVGWVDEAGHRLVEVGGQFAARDGRVFVFDESGNLVPPP